jgi:hypothetical protein
MYRWVALVVLGMSACEVVEPTGGLLEPARVAVVPGPSEPGPDSTQDGYDFDAYKREQAEVDGVVNLDEAGEVLEALGADPKEVEVEPAAGDKTPPVVDPAPAVHAATSIHAAPPIHAVEVSMGVRLVATLEGTSPPRAVLGLSSGQERVVQAGDMLPEAGVVVLAVGRDLVQIAQIQRRGDHASIEPVFLRSLFSGSRDGR